MRLTLPLLTGLSFLVAAAPSLGGCGSSDSGPASLEREEGQSDFSSAPPAGQAQGGSFGGQESGAGAPSSDGAGKVGDASKTARQVEETDLYRIEKDRLYYLNSYRGLMVFDVSNVDQPKLLGRSPIFGTPVEMYVINGIATVVVGDWYGNGPDGAPFHGSIVRSIDATDPANMKVTGEALLKGWARDMRVVGTNLYVVSEDYGWAYGGWYWGGPWGGVAEGAPAADAPFWYGGASKVVISSVSIAGGKATLKGSKEYDGYSGAFNVQAYSILLAHDVTDPATKRPTGKARLEYIDISDAGGAIVPKGSIEVTGLLQGWSADNGRWNVDFDGTTASVLTRAATCSRRPTSPIRRRPSRSPSSRFRTRAGRRPRASTWGGCTSRRARGPGTASSRRRRPWTSTICRRRPPRRSPARPR